MFESGKLDALVGVLDMCEREATSTDIGVIRVGRKVRVKYLDNVELHSLRGYFSSGYLNERKNVVSSGVVGEVLSLRNWILVGFDENDLKGRWHTSWSDLEGKQNAAGFYAKELSLLPWSSRQQEQFSRERERLDEIIDSYETSEKR